MKKEKTRQLYPSDDWPEEILVLLGKIVIAGAQLDYVIDVSLKRATGESFSIGMSEAARTFKIDDRLTKIGDVVNKRFNEDTKAQFEEIRSKVEEILDNRNKVIHALYAMNDKGDRERIVRVNKDPYAGKNLGVDSDELITLLNRLRYYRYRLDNITREMFLARQVDPSKED